MATLNDSATNISSSLNEIEDSTDRMQAYLGSIDDSLTRDGWAVLISDKERTTVGGEYSIDVVIRSIPTRLGITSVCVLVAQVDGPSGFNTYSQTFFNPTKATLAAAEYHRQWHQECEADIQSRQIEIDTSVDE